MPATVTMEMPALTGFNNRTLTLAARETRLIGFGESGHDAFADAQMDTIQNNVLNTSYVGVKYNRGIHFSATAPVNIYYQADGTGSKDMFVFKGDKALGTKFYTPFQTDYNNSDSGYSQFHIVATEDDTEVTVTPRANIVGTNSGASKTVTLDRGETFTARASTSKQGKVGDPATWLAGSHIVSDKPVAVTVADDAVLVAGADMAGDQIVPFDHTGTTSIGTTYIVIRGYSNTGVERVYVLATEDGTNVYVDDSPVPDATLNKGEQYTHAMPDTKLTSVIRSDKPVYVFQLSGYGNEACAALIPSMYSINSRRVTFYKREANQHYAFVLVRDGNEGFFTVNGDPGVLQAGDFTDVPHMSGWKYARKDIHSIVANGTVTVNNSGSAFALGYFYTGITTGTVSFGYFSEYGTLSFPDTTYKCAGETVTLDGGYAKNYRWTLPDGTVQEGATLSTLAVSDTGRYTVIVDQNPLLTAATTVVRDRFDGAALVITGSGDAGIGMGAGTYTYGLDLKGQPASTLSYAWTVGGDTVSTAATYVATWTNADEPLITVEITDDATGCTQTLSTLHHRLPDNISDAGCFIDPPATDWSIKETFRSTAQASNLTPYATPIVGDLDDDGIPEILVYKYRYVDNGQRRSDGVYVFWGKNRATPTLISFPSSPSTVTANYMHPMGTLAKIELDGVMKPVLFILSANGYLYAFDPVAGTPLTQWNGGGVPGRSDQRVNDWIEPYTYDPYIINTLANVGVADFDGDGKVEVYASKSVWAAENGKLLAQGSASGNKGYMQGLEYTELRHYYTVAADVDGDGVVELAAGTQVYDVHIPVRTGTDAANTMEIKYQLPSPPTVNDVTVADGITVVADVNQDGQLDVIVSNNQTVSNSYTVRGVFLCIVIASAVKQSMRVQGGFVPRSDV